MHGDTNKSRKDEPVVGKRSLPLELPCSEAKHHADRCCRKTQSDSDIHMRLNAGNLRHDWNL